MESHHLHPLHTQTGKISRASRELSLHLFSIIVVASTAVAAIAAIQPTKQGRIFEYFKLLYYKKGVWICIKCKEINDDDDSYGKFLCESMVHYVDVMYYGGCHTTAGPAAYHQNVLRIQSVGRSVVQWLRKINGVRSKVIYIIKWNIQNFQDTYRLFFLFFKRSARRRRRSRRRRKNMNASNNNQRNNKRDKKKHHRPSGCVTTTATKQQKQKQQWLNHKRRTSRKKLPEMSMMWNERQRRA